ncbi:MAG: DALR domain-containing protein, partial [Gemmatimonadota bacterium]
ADDLDAPAAVAALFEFVRAANRELDRGVREAGPLARAREVFARVDGVLDLIPEPAQADAELAAWVEERLAARREARARRDFGTADAIRDELSAKGIVIEDAGGTTRWKAGIR